MACWVVPAIAAELWGVSVNHVLAGIRDGSIASHYEHGFLCVDAAPGSYTYRRPRRADEPALPTYVMVQPEAQSLAPQGASPDGPSPDGPPSEVPSSEVPSSAALSLVPVPFAEDDELPPLDLEEDDAPLPPRDAVRAAVSRQRRRPLAA